MGRKVLRGRLRFLGGSLQRIFGGEQPAESRDDGGLRLAYRRDRLIVLPAPAETLAERDVLFADHHLSGRVLLLDVVLLALGIDHIEKVCQSPVVALRREAQRGSLGEAKRLLLNDDVQPLVLRVVRCLPSVAGVRGYDAAARAGVVQPLTTAAIAPACR